MNEAAFVSTAVFVEHEGNAQDPLYHGHTVVARSARLPRPGRRLPWKQQQFREDALFGGRGRVSGRGSGGREGGGEGLTVEGRQEKNGPAEEAELMPG